MPELVNGRVPFSLCGHRVMERGVGASVIGERYLEGQCPFCCPRCKGIGVVEMIRADGSLKRDGERSYHDCTCVDGKAPGFEPPKSDSTPVFAGDRNPNEKVGAAIKVLAKKPIPIDDLIDKLSAKLRIPRGEADAAVRRALNHGYIRTGAERPQADLMKMEDEGT